MGMHELVKTYWKVIYIQYLGVKSRDIIDWNIYIYIYDLYI